MFVNAQSVQTSLKLIRGSEDCFVREIDSFNRACPRTDSFLEDGYALRPWNVVTQRCPRNVPALISERVMPHRSWVGHTLEDNWFTVTLSWSDVVMRQLFLLDLLCRFALC